MAPRTVDLTELRLTSSAYSQHIYISKLFESSFIVPVPFEYCSGDFLFVRGRTQVEMEIEAMYVNAGISLSVITVCFIARVIVSVAGVVVDSPRRGTRGETGHNLP